ncbi:MAG TPA: ribonuclease H-like domain-containing protein [Vicinamibacteria bacterium]|nr:ribonuclease H-like domain-containing protein [Vicinamibacteria bacterium]
MTGPTGNLHDRLQRLRRPAAAESSGSGLERLERELLGETRPLAAEEERLPLKVRLERLVAVAALRERRRGIAPVPLEELVDGMRVLNERGEFFRVESSVHLEVRHGDVPLSRVHAIAPDTVGVLTAEPELESFDLRGAVFLDTETTGLAGGAGTAAFLIGIGWVDGERFRVRQYFMRDYHEEGALLHALASELEQFDRLVTFNGKMFDVPLLDARFRLNRVRFPLAGSPHFDLLHPARRLWKARLESCRLQSLEAELMGLRRHGDIPGEEIPQVYFDWVRRRDARLLARVFEHNRQDIVSLAALAVLACQWVEEARAEDPRDIFSLGRVLERGRRYERSEACYRRALSADSAAVRGPALLRLGWRAKRGGDHARAAELWAQAGEAGEVEGWRELAMHHEHRSRDLEQALVAVERGMRLVEAAARDDRRARHQAEALERRRQRLQRKQARR